MIIYTEFLDCLDAAVDQPQSILLSTGEAEFGQASIVDAGSRGAVACAVATCKVHLSIDEIVVRWWSNQIFVCDVCPHHTFKYGVVVLVIVVIERYRTKVDVICLV